MIKLPNGKFFILWKILFNDGIDKPIRYKLKLGDCMENKWYLKPIIISDSLILQLDPKQEAVIFYENNEMIDRFALNRKIYTFFKYIQSLLQSPTFLTIENNLGDVYSGDIHLDDKIMMHVTNTNGYLTVNFYHKTNKKQELLFLMPLTYTTNTLFKNMLIPYHLLKDPSYRIRHIFKFLDMMQILNLLNQNEREIEHE